MLETLHDILRAMFKLFTVLFISRNIIGKLSENERKKKKEKKEVNEIDKDMESCEMILGPF